jgi:hypothetical protein
VTSSTIPVHVPATTPYAWPWGGQLDPRRTALVVVGPAKGLSVVGTDEGDRLREIVDGVSSSGGAVIQVVTAPPPAAVGPEVGAPLAALGTSPTPVLTARGIDGFFESGLETHLRHEGLDHLLLAGAGLETCVHSTMRSANDRGLECLLVLDACVAYDRGLVASARSQVEMSGGIFGAVGSSANVLAALTSFDPERLHP